MTRIVAAVVVVGIVSAGVVMRFGAWTHDGLVRPETYDAMFRLHAALSFALLSIVLAALAPSRAHPSWLRPTLAGVFVLAALLVTFDVPLDAVAHPSPRAVACAVLGVAAVVGVLASVPLDAARAWAGALFVVAGLALAAAWLAPFTVLPIGGAAAFTLVVAVLAAPALGDAPSLRTPILVTAALYLAARGGVRFAGVSPLALVELLAGGTLAVLVFVAARPALPWPRATRRLEAVLFGEAVLGSSFLGLLEPDVRIHDTLFVIAVAHLELFVLVVALARDLGGTAAPRAAWAALAGAFAGAQVFALAFLALGARGMPRRYAAYLPEFQGLQRTASLGAFVLAVGAVGLVYVVARTRRRTP